MDRVNWKSRTEGGKIRRFLQKIKVLKVVLFGFLVNVSIRRTPGNLRCDEINNISKCKNESKKNGPFSV